jgi:hypothetical protein
MAAEFHKQEYIMKNKSKLFGTQSLLFCVITLTTLFAFAITACDNGSTSSGKTALTGTVTITNSESNKETYDIGDTVTADVSGLNAASGFTYQWQISDTQNGTFTDIEDAAESDFDIPADTEGKWIKVVVSHPDYTGSVTSDPVQVNPGVNALTGQVDIPWIIVVGQTVEADITQLGNGGTISYQWMKSDDQNEFTNITSATGKTFQVSNDLSGKYLQVVVKREGKTGTVASNAVKVRATAPVVSGVTINEGDVDVSKGDNYSFTATVNGTNLEPEDQDVTWSVTGGDSHNTHISGGYLSVGANETATELKVIATSKIDPTKYGEVTVNVTEFSGNIITITGLGSMKGSIGVHILSSLDPDDYEADVASGYADIFEGAITADLKVFVGFGVATPWEDTGEFYIKLKGTYDSYVYTNGAAINMTDIDSNPKYNFEEKDTTIDFSKFAMIPLGEGGYKITISGLGSYNGAMASVELSVSGEFDSYPVADGHAVITGGSVTITLSDLSAYDDGLTGWTDGGECFITLSIDGKQGEWDPIPSFVYTNGSSLTSLSITTWNDFYEKAPKVNFTSETTTVGFDKFVPGDGIDYDFGW